MWFGYMDERSLDLVPRVKGRLYPAFEAVLARVSDDEFRRFMDADPRLICLPGSRAKVFAVSTGTAIYFDPVVLRQNVARLVNEVAHEVAQWYSATKTSMAAHGTPPRPRRTNSPFAGVSRRCTRRLGSERCVRRSGLRRAWRVVGAVSSPPRS